MTAPTRLGEMLALVDETRAAYWTAGGIEWRAVHDAGAAGPRVLFQAHDREGRWITWHTLEAFFGAPARIVPATPAPPTFDLGANLDVLLAYNAKRAANLGPVAALMFGLAVVGAVAAAERHGFDRRDMLGMFARFERPTMAVIDGLRVAAIVEARRG